MVDQVWEEVEVVAEVLEEVEEGEAPEAVVLVAVDGGKEEDDDEEEDKAFCELLLQYLSCVLT